MQFKESLQRVKMETPCISVPLQSFYETMKEKFIVDSP